MIRWLSGLMPRLREMHFDLLHGVTTRGLERLESLRIETSNDIKGRKYQGIDPRVFKQLFRTLPIDHQRFEFVDLGSGKARALLLASRLPFKRLTGIEFSPEMHAIGKENIRRYRTFGRRRPAIDVHLMDAAQYEIPEDPCVFFLYNSFGEDVLSKVLDNIKQSVEKSPREVFFAYTYPGDRPPLHALLETRGFEAHGQSPWWTVYRTS